MSVCTSVVPVATRYYGTIYNYKYDRRPDRQPVRYGRRAENGKRTFGTISVYTSVANENRELVPVLSAAYTHRLRALIRR